MVNIACLGWGSLVWHPEELPIRTQWYKDGPQICAEFLRVSVGNRLTLVLHENAEPVQSLWAMMDGEDISLAKEALRQREGNTRGSWIGCWTPVDDDPALVPSLRRWADDKGLDAVIWSAMPAKFDGVDGQAPTPDQAVAHLRSLQGAELYEAERYVRYAPAQIDTAYRRRIEADLNWPPADFPDLEHR